MADNTKMANRLGLDLRFYRYRGFSDYVFDLAGYEKFVPYTVGEGDEMKTYDNYFSAPTTVPDGAVKIDTTDNRELAPGAGLAEIYSIDFANEVSYEIESGLVWATGGQSHSNMVGFKDPTTGTLTITTQIITDKLKAIAAGMNLEDIDGDDTPMKDGKVVSFKNDKHSVIPQSYIVTGDTLFQDVDGTEHTETLIFYKATVSPAMSRTYTGDGDPQEIEIELELGTNESDMVHDSFVSYENKEEPVEP